MKTRLNDYSRLLQIKTRKEQEALRQANESRRAVEEAQAATKLADEEARRSREKLPGEIDAIDKRMLIGQVVKPHAFEDAKARVASVVKKHEQTEDMAKQRRFQQTEKEEECRKSVFAHREAQRKVQKFEFMTEEERKAYEEAIQRREETEIEDLVNRNRGMPGLRSNGESVDADHDQQSLARRRARLP